MSATDLETLALLAREGDVEWRTIPDRHQPAFLLFASGMTFSASASGETLVPVRNWRAYLAFLKQTELLPEQVTEAAIGAWHARRRL